MGNYYYRHLFLSYMLLPMFLAGCHFKDESSKAVITEIKVTPETVSLARNLTRQLTVMATYSDNTSSDITKSVIWTPADTSTAVINSSGLLLGVDIGTTTVTASKDGITSNSVNVNVCESLADECIDILDVGGGKLFINAPSTKYLDSIGGSVTGGTNYSESGSKGPIGTFYISNWSDAKAICEHYTNQKLEGRINWRLPTKDELTSELFSVFGNLFIKRGWPTSILYWTITPDGFGLYYIVSLIDGTSLAYDPNDSGYTACVSPL